MWSTSCRGQSIANTISKRKHKEGVLFLYNIKDICKTLKTYARHIKKLRSSKLCSIGKEENK